MYGMLYKTAVLITGAVLLNLCGCQDTCRRECLDPNDVTARVLRERRENMASTVDWICESEARRPEQLASTVEVIERQHRKDCENCRRNVSTLNRWIEQEFVEWEKNQPEYRRRIAEELSGDCDNLIRTAPRVIY